MVYCCHSVGSYFPFDATLDILFSLECFLIPMSSPKTFRFVVYLNTFRFPLSIHFLRASLILMIYMYILYLFIMYTTIIGIQVISLYFVFVHRAAQIVIFTKALLIVFLSFILVVYTLHMNNYGYGIYFCWSIVNIL